MSIGNTIPVPPATAARLREWLRLKAEVEGLVETTIGTLREALNVPEDWQIRSIDEGFVAPPTPSAADAGTETLG